MEIQKKYIYYLDHNNSSKFYQKKITDKRRLKPNHLIITIIQRKRNFRQILIEQPSKTVNQQSSSQWLVIYEMSSTLEAINHQVRNQLISLRDNQGSSWSDISVSYQLVGWRVNNSPSTQGTHRLFQSSTDSGGVRPILKRDKFGKSREEIV